MVGLVIVSHSAKIAEGIRELAMEMADKGLKIIPAGGMEDGSIGTDALKINEAIIKANTGDGVVVLADLGSAVMSSGMAIDLLDKAVARVVRIADAPIVEGAISAAVQASLGASLKEVVSAAEESRSFSKL